MNEINQLEMVTYMIVSSRNITEFKDKDIENYIDILEDELMVYNPTQIFNYVNMKLFNNFIFRQVLDEQEVKNYAILIYRRLLNYYNKSFNTKDIIKESEYIFSHYSVRKAKEKVDELSIKV